MGKVIMTNMCMIINKDTNEVLVQERVKKSWPGIAFPGGHIEEGESIVDSTIREVKEETGLDIQELKLSGIKNWYNKEENFRYLVFLFKTENYNGKLITNGVEGDVFWVKISELFSLSLAEGFKEMLEVMTEDSINEYYIVGNNKKTDYLRLLK